VYIDELENLNVMPVHRKICRFIKKIMYA